MKREIINCNSNQIFALNARASQHEKAGNAVLALWMRESADKLISSRIKTDKILDEIEEARDCFEIEETYRHEVCKFNTYERESYRSEWYDMEEEWL